jgi:hypothetical protein
VLDSEWLDRLLTTVEQAGLPRTKRRAEAMDARAPTRKPAAEDASSSRAVDPTARAPTIDPLSLDERLLRAISWPVTACLSLAWRCVCAAAFCVCAAAWLLAQLALCVLRLVGYTIFLALIALGIIVEVKRGCRNRGTRSSPMRAHSLRAGSTARSASRSGGSRSAGAAAGPQRQAEPCAICFTEPRDFQLDNCGCWACISCLAQHATSEAQQNRWPRCPLCVAAGGAAGAGGHAANRIGRQQLEVLLEPHHLHRLEAAQMERDLGVRRCPHCAEGLELDQGVDLLTAVCYTCGRPVHVEDEAAERAFREYRQQQRFRECARCGATVEKKEGCNHMTCLCTNEFCYLCGEDLNDPIAFIGHFGPGRCNQFDRRAE